MQTVQRRVMRGIKDMKNKVYKAIRKHEDCVAYGKGD